MDGTLIVNRSDHINQCVLKPPAIAIDEFLRRAEGRVVGFIDTLYQLEGIAEFVVHRVGAISNDVQAAAFFGAFEAEGSDDDVSADFYASHHEFDVFASVFGVGQEMKDCPVMPYIVMVFGKFGSRNVSFDPVDESRP